MNNTIEQNKTMLTAQVLNTLTRDELRAMATHFAVSVGKNKGNPINNLLEAVKANKAWVKMTVYIGHPPKEGHTYGRFIFAKKFRSYKEDKIVQPLPPIGVPSDSPSDQG